MTDPKPEPEGPRIQDLISTDAPMGVDWGEPEPVDPKVMDEVRKSMSSEGLRKNITEIAADPKRLAEATQETDAVFKAQIDTYERFSALPKKLQLHHRREMKAVMRDIARDLGYDFSQMDHLHRASLVIILMGDDDDDRGDDEVPSAPPSDGSSTPVLA